MACKKWATKVDTHTRPFILTIVKLHGIVGSEATLYLRHIRSFVTNGIIKACLGLSFKKLHDDS